MADTNDKPKRQPVPAGGDVIPAALEAAEATPPAGGDEDDASSAPEHDAEPGELVEARVLLAFEGHEPGDVVALPATQIEQHKLNGHVDPHPDAVAYAKGRR